MNNTLDLNGSQLGFNRVMQMNTKLIELEMSNKGLIEEKSQLEVELHTKTTLLEKFNNLKGSDQAYAHPGLKSELDRLNIEFKDSIEDELNAKARKANKTMSSLKEIIEQK